MRDLAKLDQEHLCELEGVIETGKRTFVAVGLALEEIRQDKLYRAGYKTFEEYCQKRWGWNAQRGRQLINSALVVESLAKELGTTVPILLDETDISERAVREIAKVPESNRADALKQASDSGSVTSKSIVAAARKVTTPPENRLDAVGRAIPAEIVPDWDRAATVAARLRACASEIKLTVERGLADKDIVFAEITNPTVAEASGLQYTLSQIAPHAVCPTCQGRNRKNCQLCRKRGWISKFLFNSPAVSAETKTIIEKAVRK